MSFVLRKDTQIPYPLKQPVEVEDAGSGDSVSNTAVSLTAATKTLTAAESGTTFILNRATGIALALPDILPDEVGTWYEFHVGTELSSGTIEFDTNGGLKLLGRVIHYDTDTSNALNIYSADGNLTYIFEMNGTTSGGKFGSWVKFVAVTEDDWVVTGIVYGTGSPERPFIDLE